MTPEPEELVQLREATRNSYALRPLPQLAGERKKKKALVWRADPALIEQLVEAEQNWRRELKRRREDAERGRSV